MTSLIIKRCKCQCFQVYGPGAEAQSEACPLGKQAAPSSILTSGTFFKTKSTVSLPLPLIQEEKLSVAGERMCSWLTT